MFDIQLDSLDADRLLTHVVEVRALAQRAEVRTLEVAAAWADLHGVIETTGVTLPGSERLVQFGGDGTPETCEFCPAELGAEMGMSPEAAAMLIGDALDLRHRLPGLWRRIRAGEVKPWIGRRIAMDTRDLTQQAAAAVDRQVARYAHSLTWGRLLKVVQAAIIEADPDFARQREQLRRRDRGVWLHPADDVGTIRGSFAAAGPDALRYNAGLDRAADALGLLGDTEPKEVRRARALGILGNPQQTMDLFAQAGLAARGRAHDPGEDADSGAMDDSGRSPFVRGEAVKVDPRPKAVLYVHLTREVLDRNDATGVARVEGVGPVTLGQARHWLSDCAVTVKPVVDIAGIAPVDSYEVPDSLREAVQLVTPADTFPFAANTGRTMDLDHTEPYVPPDEGGPPGQTAVGRLGPMTRRHHRIKTHGRWQVRQPFAGVFVWRSPHGRHYVVDQTGTHRVACGDAA
ncbi:MAG: DUF222 domain-containing protein [Nocardioidaceae bacterium]|nr:DUF222 domain-containing protein [Nocardioidaceae bacterium]